MNEPLFRNIKRGDEAISEAHAQAANTVFKFKNFVEKHEDSSDCMAKLRFRDPDISEETGENQYLYMWLYEVVYHREDNLFSGVFLEVPEEMQKWHQVGQRLGFEADDIFDWMVIENGHMSGGYTIRLTRSRLNSEKDKAEYDEYIGIESYNPVD